MDLDRYHLELQAIDQEKNSVRNYVPLYMNEDWYKSPKHAKATPLMSQELFSKTSLGKMSKERVYTEILFYIPVNKEPLEELQSSLIAIQKNVANMILRRQDLDREMSPGLLNRQFKPVVVIMYESWSKFIKQYRQSSFHKYFDLFVDLHQLKTALQKGLGKNGTGLEKDLDILHCFCVKTNFNELGVSLLRLNIIFCIKNKKGNRFHSHQWLFNGLCNMIDPTFIQLMTIGAWPLKNGLSELYCKMLKNSSLGAVTGYISTHNSTGFNLLTAAQNLEYKFKNLFDYRLESNLGYLSYLSQDFTCIRWVSIKGKPLHDHYFKAVRFYKSEENRKTRIRRQNDDRLKMAQNEINRKPTIISDPLPNIDLEKTNANSLAKEKRQQNRDKISADKQRAKFNESLKTRDFGLIEANFHNTIERILPFTIFLSNVGKSKSLSSGNLIKYVPTAKCEVSVPSEMHEFLITRRGEINSGWLSTLYFFKYIRLMAGAGGFNCFLFSMELFWNMLNFIFQWFLVGIFGLTFSVILRDTFPEISGNSFNVLDYIILAYYGFLITTLIVSMSTTSKDSSVYFEVSSAIYALVIIATIGMFIYGHLDLEFENQWMGLLILFTAILFIIFMILYGELDQNLVFYTVPFILMVPTYVNILFVYSTCNIHDCSRNRFKVSKPEEEQMVLRSKSRAILIFIWVVCNYMFVYLIDKAIRIYEEKSYYASYFFTAIAFFLLIGRMLATLMFSIGRCFSMSFNKLFGPTHRKRKVTVRENEVKHSNSQEIQMGRLDPVEAVN